MTMDRDLREAAKALLAKLDVYCGRAPVWKVEQDALRSALAADADRVSVPREPTMDMLMAMEDAWDKALDVRLDADSREEWPSEKAAELCSRAVYRAMLATHEKEPKNA